MEKEKEIYEFWFNLNASVVLEVGAGDKSDYILEAERKIKKELKHTDLDYSDLDFRDAEKF